jgi:TolB-like protein
MAADEPRRRLAVIVAADVVGFSRLAEANERSAVAALATLRRAVIDPAVKAGAGRIFKSTGDGVLAEFSSPVEAVGCALAIQRRVEQGGEPGVPPLVLRIGIHIGDVMVEGSDLMGDVVNVAARIEGEAPPGGVALSQDVWRFVEGKTDGAFEDAGERQLKNIVRPIRLYVARMAGPTGGPPPTRRVPLTDRPSLAVLPFDNLAGESADSALCDGLTEDLITDLSRFRSLMVIARNSSFVYRGKPHDIRKVGQELDVRYVLEGSIRRLGDKIRINAQLIDAENGHHVWAERYDGPADELFTIQESVVRNIAGHLVLQLEYAELAEAKRKPPESLRAYALWLEGTEQHSFGTIDAHDKARALFEAALAVEPGFARAHSSLAELTYFDTFLSNWGVDRTGAFERAVNHAERAVTFDPNDGMAHVILGWAHLMSGRFDRALKHVETAEQLNPNDAEIAMSRATALAFLGDPTRGLEIAAFARRLNPFAPDWYLSDEAVIRLIGRDPAGALAIYDAMGELYPHSIVWHVAAAGHAGRETEARRLAADFAQRAARLWVGDANARPADYARWVLAGFPFRNAEDADYLRAGLTRAGLDV